MSKKVNHHAKALELLVWVIGWLVVACGGFVGVFVLGGILVQEARDNLPPETWWVFWPLVAMGFIYWLGWLHSKEMEESERAHEEWRISKEVQEAYDTLGN